MQMQKAIAKCIVSVYFYSTIALRNTYNDSKRLEFTEKQTNKYTSNELVLNDFKCVCNDCLQ